MMKGRGQTKLLYLTVVVMAVLGGPAGLLPALAGGKGQDGGQSVVHAVLFFSPTCPHCHYVMQEVLPPLEARYGDGFDLLKIDASEQQGWGLFQAAVAAFAVPPQRQGVPMLILGHTVLVGSGEIPAQLPSLIEEHLEAGGIGWPAIPGLEGMLPSTPQPSEEATPPVVHILVFWSTECVACRKVVGETLPPLREQYPGRLEVELIDIVTADDVDWLYRVAAQYGLDKDEVNLPLLIIGDEVLIGYDQIPAELPGLIERYLAAGGAEPADLTRLAEQAPASAAEAPASGSGFALALAAMAGMVAALAYSGFALAAGGRRQPPAAARKGTRQSAATPWLAAIGAAIAGYLAYVETRAVPAVCGPVGDCNAVQTSEYARLFGVLPIGVLGLIGYVGILAVWLWGRFRDDGLAHRAPLLLFVLAAGGVLFSLYLTYLERFVIRAICAWCVASAVVMTLLLLDAIRPARQALRQERRGWPTLA